jgi:hypothetical protein
MGRVDFLSPSSARPSHSLSNENEKNAEEPMRNSVHIEELSHHGNSETDTSSTSTTKRYSQSKIQNTHSKIYTSCDMVNISVQSRTGDTNPMRSHIDISMSHIPHTIYSCEYLNSIHIYVVLRSSLYELMVMSSYLMSDN